MDHLSCRQLSFSTTAQRLPNGFPGNNGPRTRPATCIDVHLEAFHSRSGVKQKHLVLQEKFFCFVLRLYSINQHHQEYSKFSHLSDVRRQLHFCCLLIFYQSFLVLTASCSSSFSVFVTALLSNLGRRQNGESRIQIGTFEIIPSDARVEMYFPNSWFVASVLHHLY